MDSGIKFVVIPSFPVDDVWGGCCGKDGDSRAVAGNFW